MDLKTNIGNTKCDTFKWLKWLFCDIKWDDQNQIGITMGWILSNGMMQKNTRAGKRLLVKLLNMAIDSWFTMIYP